MPDDNKNHERSKIPSIIKKLADSVNSNMNDLYSKTYFSSPSNRNDLLATKSKINKTKNAIMIAENLIKNKDFSDVVIFVNGNSVNVVVKEKTLKTEQIAQIQNIVTREIENDIENIHISCKE